LDHRSQQGGRRFRAQVGKRVVGRLVGQAERPHDVLHGVEAADAFVVVPEIGLHDLP
jgi:hypothetical protein